MKQLYFNTLNRDSRSTYFIGMAVGKSFILFTYPNRDFSELVIDG